MINENINILEFCKKPGQFETVNRVSSEWPRSDYSGSIKCRISDSFRMKYKIEPGLYAIGEPDGNSDVFASANYKLSFDILRKALSGVSAWILVLDTKGINVWCAAGKGTFGAEELVKRISKVKLGNFLNHRRIIVPQLGAVGVNADAVFKQTGFKVYFGPVYAKDIKAYLKAGKRKTPEMRKVKFSILDRLVLTPREIIPAISKFLIFAVIALLFFGIQPTGILFKSAWVYGGTFLLLGLTSIIAGSFITPVILPFIPFRSFAVKGWIIGILLVIFVIFSLNLPEQKNILIFSAEILFFPMASSYLALQFTGSTTFTNMSGVKKELKIALPVYLISAAISIILLIIYKLHKLAVI
ncbi:MAG: mercury methylation corrinoid protein HgcA [Deltaproteobacteria bacterium]|nr:mercury methylation corrinoid protein HgcA [Deltaproteobacteria bacterium]MCL5893054.1 mercury methylation corrinoid protein HgcA [Deltaproteobacteria bacterium]